MAVLLFRPPAPITHLVSVLDAYLHQVRPSIRLRGFSHFSSHIVILLLLIFLRRPPSDRLKPLRKFKSAAKDHDWKLLVRVVALGQACAHQIRHHCCLLT